MMCSMSIRRRISAQAWLERAGGREPDHITYQLISKRKAEWQDSIRDVKVSESGNGRKIYSVWTHRN